MDHYHYYANSTNVSQTAARNMEKDGDNSYSITPAIHRAVFVNNEGTKLVRQCQYDTAVKSFTAVLKILKPLAALVEANGNNEVAEIPSDDCIPMSITFANNSIGNDSIGNSSEERSDMNTSTNPSFDSLEALRQTNSESSEETESQPQSPPVSGTYWNTGGGAGPSNLRNKKQRRLSAAAAAKLLAASGPPNKYARRTTSHFVFRDPVEIPPESVPSDLSVDSSELFSKFLMIVMYNLALTLHLHAMSLSNANGDQKPTLSLADSNHSGNADAKKAKKLFLRSRKLYELAFEMHLDESCDVNLLFTLALINNLGLVYDILGQKQRSKTCFKNMFSTMMYLMDSNESHTVKEWDGLLSNVMDILFQQHREIAAPAA